MDKKLGVGVIGCGNISTIYLTNLSNMFSNTKVVACADMFYERAVETAKKFNIPRAQTVEELINNPEVDVVLNITIPKAHYEISKAALLAGKHVYTEKPLALEVSEGKELVDLAKEKGLYLGCSPDTVLGGSIQTCRDAIDSGLIGKPLSATVTFHWHGPEHEHPNPGFLYQYGAGPIFDYGPYYFTTLVTLLGPVKQVCSMAGKGFDTRTCTCPGPNNGKEFPVEIPTHVTGAALMENGVLATVIQSWDMWATSEAEYAIFGTEGTLYVPDPDKYGEPAYLLRKGAAQPEELPNTHHYNTNSRGLGISEMIASISEGKQPIASGEVGLHVLEVMHAFTESAERQAFVTIKSTCERPEAFGRKTL